MAENENNAVVPTQTAYTSRLNRQVVDGLKSRYPFIQVGSIGRSVMGREIPYIRIGTGGTQVFYNASFHANENITTPVLLKFVEEYAGAYENNRDLYGVSAQALYENYQLYVVPMVNPDGVDLVNGALTSGIYYRNARAIAEDYPTIPFPSGWKANIDGIDLNLQFPAGWEKAKEIKFAQGYTSPAPRDYVGSAPLVAPESAAVYRFTQEHDFSLILAYHTQGQVIYWKYLDYEPERSYEIARYFGDVSGYLVEETPQESGYAGYKDWFIQEYNRPGYTIEVGLGENPLPMSQFAQIYEDNKVLEYCKANDIQFICYQPLRRNRTAMRNYDVLVELAEKYNKTQNQIIINWIVKEKNILPLIKCTDINRINENLSAINFAMETADYKKLNDFRNKDFDNVEIDWYCKGGITIDQLANQFE